MDHRTLIDLLLTTASVDPGKTALTFLRDGEEPGESISYGDLLVKAKAMAACLQQQAVAGDRALLLFNSGLDYVIAFWGCILSGVIAVPAYPPRRNRNLDRISSIVKDCGACVAITSTQVHNDISRHFPDDDFFKNVNWIVAENVPEGTWSKPDISADCIAFLQYTSGSTGTPKGVMITHRNILYNLSELDHTYHHSADSVMVTWLPIFHDLGLIYGILQPVFNGFSCYVMAPADFLQRPARWLEAISKYKGTHSPIPNFAFDLCLKKVSEKQVEALELSSWKVALVAAEPVRAATLRDFYKKFSRTGFKYETYRPAYGLAEATLKVATVPAGTPTHTILHQPEPGGHPVELVAHGNGVLQTKLVVVHPETFTRCREGEEGEIWIAGPTLAKGYWNRPEETRETFEARINGENKTPFLRTGDLGLMKDNALFITGRIKDLVIIRGSNYYPHDLELLINKSHPWLKMNCGVVFSADVDGEERLLVMQELERHYLDKPAYDEVYTAICKNLFDEYGITPYEILLLKTGTLPKTSSGKLQRMFCRKEYLAGNVRAHRSWRPAYKASRENADALLAWMRRYAEERINSRLIDERRSIPPHIILDFGTKGLFGLCVDKSKGGLHLAEKEVMRIMSQLGGVDISIAMLVCLHNALGIRPLYHATHEMQNKWLPLLATGRALAAFAITESIAGSDPRNLKSSATTNGDGWLLNGRKIWTGTASWAGLIHVFTQLYTDKGKPLGITGFSLEQGTTGLTNGPEALTMGLRGMVQNAVIMENVKVDAASMLGEPGSGMTVALDAMMYARLMIAAITAGAMKRCVQYMHRYASGRKVITGNLMENPVTQWRMAEAIMRISLVDNLVETISESLDEGINVPPELYAISKIAGPEFLGITVDHAMQLLGGRGYMENNMLPQLFRDARLCRIFEGPSETLLMYLGSGILNNYEALSGFITQTLNAGDAASALLKSANALFDEIKAEYAKMGSLQATRMAHYRIGELAVMAVLHACSRHKSSHRAAAYAWKNFLSKAPIHAGNNVVLDGIPFIREEIIQYATAIGDIRCMPAGEEVEMDPLLAAEHQIAETNTILHVTGLPGNEKKIYEWICTWLVENMKIDRTSIKPEYSFFSYGLDSVTAVELSMELGAWLQQDVDVTMFWNFPTIPLIAKHLATEQSTPGELSVAEMANLLSQAITKK